MLPLTPSEIRVGTAYEEARAESRRRTSELKRHRRVALGDALSLVFENRDTMRAVVEEMLRAERVEDPAEVADDVAAVNAVGSRPGQLTAVLYLEASDPAELRSIQAALREVQTGLFLEIGDVRIDAVTAPPPVEEESPAAFLLSFQVGADGAEALRSGAAVVVGVAHPSYSARTALDEEQRRALATDL